MFAAHFAAGLAIGAKEKKAPMSALLAGAFLPDVIWIALSLVGLEPSEPSSFFDGWSHSLLSVMVEATLFALFFTTRGVRVWLPIWLAVMSHAALDGMVHPKPLEFYPYSSLRLPWDLWQWGSHLAFLGFSHYWWLQFSLVALFLGLYAMLTRRSSIPRHLACASILLVFGLHWIL